MGEVINMRLARKAKVRADKSRQADENRARFGRTKEQRIGDAVEESRKQTIVDGAFRVTKMDQEEF